MALEWPRKRCKNSVHVAIYFLTLFFFIQHCKNLQATKSSLENLAVETLYDMDKIMSFSSTNELLFYVLSKGHNLPKRPFYIIKKNF